MPTTRTPLPAGVYTYVGDAPGELACMSPLGLSWLISDLEPAASQGGNVIVSGPADDGRMIAQTGKLWCMPIGRSASEALFTAGGAPSDGSATTTQEADDTSLVQSDMNADAVVGKWKELMPASATRKGAVVQNKDAAALVFWVQSDAAPADGSRPGEAQIAIMPAGWRFDFRPKRRYWFRSTVSASKISLQTW